jgi:SMP-30/Gluconolactonase/LRE-like region
VLLSGAGPSNLSPSSFSGVFKINSDGTMTMVADLTSWLPQHPPKFISPDYGSDGSLFDLEAAGDSLLLSEAVGGQLIKVTPAGETSTVADLSEGHMVPTGVAVDADGNAYVGFETTPPYADGSSKVVKVTPDGTVSDFWTGLTAVTDVEFGPDGALYATEMATGNTGSEPFLNPNSGRIVRQTGPATLEPVVTDLPYPVHIGFEADGRMMIALPAFGPDGGVGLGSLISVDIGNDPVSYAGFEAPATCSA